MLLAGVVMFLLTVGWTSWWAWRDHQRLVMTRADLRTLVEAAQRFHREYDRWPGSRLATVADQRFGGRISNAEIMNILRAVDGPGNEQHAANDQQIVFIEAEAFRPGWSGLDPEGAFRDPWGTPYQMVFDSNYDQSCEIENSVYGRLIGQELALWSCGQDRMSDTPDDLLSWSHP